MRVRTRSWVFAVSTGAAVLLAGSALSINPASAAANPHASRVRTPQAAASGRAGAQSLLVYGGGPVVHIPQVIVDFWGSGWGTNGSRDPSHEAPYVMSFLQGIGQTNDTWSTSTTQYCSGVASGATSCPSGSSVVGPPPSTGALINEWFHPVKAPTRPNQGQLAAEAAAAYSHFGLGSTANVQIVVATAHGNNSSGFGVQYCAWHSATSVSGGQLSYTNLPYITDAGASCGANFVSSALDGISIVEGHEYAETVTDPVPSSGWVDPSGAENGDKCAWISPGQQGGAADVSLGSRSFAVQSLFSNSFAGAGGCVISYTNGGATQS